MLLLTSAEDSETLTTYLTICSEADSEALADSEASEEDVRDVSSRKFIEEGTSEYE